MKQRDDTVYLRDMLDAIQQIESYLKNCNFEQFKAERMRQDATVRQIEVIGEACRKLSPEFRDGHDGISWKAIIGMRHKIAHDYFAVDIQTVWDTAQTDLPDLESKLMSILRLEQE